MNERSRFDLLHAMSIRGSNNRNKKNDDIMTSKKNVQQKHPSSKSSRRRIVENIETNNNQLNTSLDILKRAQQEKSLDLYSQGLEQLLKYMKQQKQQSSQLETLRELATVYMSEAETLKQQQKQKESMTNNNHALMIPPHLDSTLVHQITSEFLFQTSNTNTNTKSSNSTTTSTGSSNWEKDIAGLESVKRSLSESFILPLQRPDLFQNHNLVKRSYRTALYIMG